MVKMRISLTLMLVVICNLFVMSCMPKERDKHQKIFHNTTACILYQDVLRVVDKLESIIKEEDQAVYDEIKRYLVNDSGYSIEAKQIIKGYWVPVDEKVAAARSKHRNYIYLFEEAGKWFTDSNNKVESLEVSQPYTNTLLLVQDAGIISKSELEILKQLCNLRVVLWVEDYIIIVNLGEKSMVVFNRGT